MARSLFALPAVVALLQLTTPTSAAVAADGATTTPSSTTIYDLTLPIDGEEVPVTDLVDPQKTKAVLVVNIKQDDPLARKNIPELLALSKRFGSQLTIIACPTDQGYYEPDTSQLIRLKLASEYNFGKSDTSTYFVKNSNYANIIITDKLNVLGSSIHPFWLWIQKACKIPVNDKARLTGNYEKFIIDTVTGVPVRRYPRKYLPENIQPDLTTLINDGSRRRSSSTSSDDGEGGGAAAASATTTSVELPPPQSNYYEEWRNAVEESKRDTYRFEKGLNYF